MFSIVKGKFYSLVIVGSLCYILLAGDIVPAACSLLCCVFTSFVLEIVALWRSFFSAHPFVEPKK